jgi:hypothetical protein
MWKQNKAARAQCMKSNWQKEMKNAKCSIRQKERSLKRNAEQYKNDLESQTVMQTKNEPIGFILLFYATSTFRICFFTIIKILGTFKKHAFQQADTNCFLLRIVFILQYTAG